MNVIKRINNNAVLCIDGGGNQVVALGRGISAVPVGSELDLDLVDRTFYDIDPRYVELIRDLPEDCLELAASVADAARSLLPYELSPNLDIALADHVAFAIVRSKKGLYVQAPLAYDLQQNYPVECKIADFALKRIKTQLGIALPTSEMAGIAMCIINGAYASAGAARTEGAVNDENMIDQAVRIIERVTESSVDRDGFGFARFATHMQYLLRRVASGEHLESANLELYRSASTDNPLAAQCVDGIAALIEEAYGQDLTEEERLYLILHINRMCSASTTT